jgi:hypothetical protein
MELRRQLATANSAANAQVVPTGIQADEDREGRACEPVEEVERAVTLPAFSRKAQDVLDELPRNIAAEALRTVGSLAAGDASAWRRVKQAKEISQPLLMVRIGIHYRLLFRVDGRTLHVVELIRRCDLETTLKRLRSSR